MYRKTLTTLTVIFALTLNVVVSQVVINEIHYNPGSAQGSDSDYEFMELYNPGSADIDMSGYSFTQGVTHVFETGTTLPAGGYIILTMPISNGDVDYNVYDPDGDGLHENGATVIPWTSGGQGNGGEDIIIVDAAGVVVDSVDYEDNSDGWSSAADGGGASLELIDPASDNSLAASWQASWVVGGTPGAASSSEPDFTVVTIYNIQYTTDVNGASTMIGDQVQTTGIVTGVDRIGNSSAFTIQDGTGAWNGIYCWWAADDGVEAGDMVTVRGTVTEYNGYGALGNPDQGLTELTNGSIVTHDTTDHALPAPVVLSLEDVGQEMYEGVLVTITGPVVEAVNDDSYGEWRMSNNLDASDTDADTINVNDRFAVTTPLQGTIATVTGPLNQWGGSSNSRPAWKVEPASVDDVEIACENADLAITIQMIDSFGDGWNGATYTVYGPQFTIMATGGLESGGFGEDTYCFSEYDAYSIVVGGGSYDNEVSFNVVDAFGSTLVLGGVANSGSFPPEPYYEFAVTGLNVSTGCTDPTAVNYPGYTPGVDDGSCYYYGDICEATIAMTGGTGVAASDMDQYFTYTAAATGNMTVSTVGQTEEDTYLVVLSSCDIAYEYDIDPDTGDTLYVTAYYEDVLAQNDDADYGLGVYQSEVTLCVTGGQEYIIAWISMYYPYDESFGFVVEETPDITTPVGVTAYGDEAGISVGWAPVPSGCAADDASRATESFSIEGPLKAKPGAKRHVLGKTKDRNLNTSARSQGSVPTLTRDCDAGATEITFYMAGSSYASECSYTVYDSEDNIVAQATGSSTTTPIAVCLTDGDYTMTGEDSYGDGWNGGMFYAAFSDGSVFYSVGMASGSSVAGGFTLNASAVYGCTDPTATNYDAAATDDDGSCLYPGDACSAPLAVDLSTGIIDSDKGWFTVDIPAGGDGTLILESSYYDYYYIYTTCDYGDGYYDQTGWAYYAYASSSTGIVEVDFSSATLDYSGANTMDTYQGTTLLIKSRMIVDYGYSRTTSISYQQTVLGCTDPNATNYEESANTDDGSCICGGTSLTMTMYDSYGDSWNGNTYVITDASSAVIASGTMPDLAGGGSAYPWAEEICLPADGNYSIYVGTAPATSGSYQSEVSWVLTSTESGQLVASGGAPFGDSDDNGWVIPLPAYTFTVYRNDAVLLDDYVGINYYDPLVDADGTTANLVAGTEYCYRVSQTVAGETPSGLSEGDCSEIYVPSTCSNATLASASAANNIDGLNGRDEWFYYVATLDGYVTVTSDLEDQIGGDTKVRVYGGTCATPIEIGYNDDGGFYNYLYSTATVVVSVGDTIRVVWENNYSPGASIWTLNEYPSGHQHPNNLTAVADHERVHLSWSYPLDALSNALRSVHSGNENTMEENLDQISIYPNETGKMEANREQMHQDYLDFIDDNPQSSRDLTGTTISIMGSVLNDDGTADIIVGLNMISPNNAWLSGVRFTLPDDIVVNSAVQTEGSTSSYDYCDEVYIEGSVVTFGDSAGVNDPDVNPDGDWGCMWGGFHLFEINVGAFSAPIEMGYLISDDCYLDFDGTLDVCGDITGTVPVDVPSDEPLCYDDVLEPNDFLGSSDTWTVVPLWGLNEDLTICPQDMDIFTVEELPYGGWVHIDIINTEATGEMQVLLWDLSQSNYALVGIISDTIDFSYQNYGGIDGSMGPAQLVMLVQGTGYASQFEYSISITTEDPEIYSYDIYSGDATDAVLAQGVLGYNYTNLGLVNGTEYSYYAVTVNEDGLDSDTSGHVSSTPRADVAYAPDNFVGQPWLNEVRLSWDAPPTQSPGNVMQSAFAIDMIPFVGSGNTANGFENNYDDCSDISDSPDAVYKYSPAADITVDISTCLSSFDTKVYVYENDDQNVVACNEDAGFYDYYYCGYYTSYSDSLTMTAGNDYYIVVDGWGGDAGYYNLQVFEHGDTTYTEGWDMDVVTTDPNHDLEQKTLAAQEHIATLDLEESSRSLVSYEVLKLVNQAWPVLATVTGTNYVDMGLAASNDEEYSYKVQAVYHGGTSPATNSVTVAPFGPIDVPVPANFTASSNGWIVNLDWDTPDLGGGEMLYSEDFESGTLGSMTSEDLSGEAQASVWSVGTVDDATSTYWSPGGNGSQFAYYNDDSWEYTYTYNRTQLTSASVDVSGLTGDAIAGLALVGDVYWTQPSGPCGGGGSYAEELEVMVSVDGGDWESRGMVESAGGWRMMEAALNLPSTATSVKVGLKYDDCGGNWGYGVAVDNFAVMVPPDLELQGYMVYKDGAPHTVTMETDFVEVANEEATHSYSVTTWVTMYGESAPAGPVDVTITAPEPEMNPPRNLMVEAEGLAAHLHWDAPAGGDQWIGHDNGMIGNALGLEDAYDFQTAVRFPAMDLIEFQGKHLQEVMFMGGSNLNDVTVSVQIHIAESGQAPVLVYESELIPGSEINEMDWNYHELEIPIPIELGQELWIGLRNISNGYSESYPVVLDNGVAHNGLGNLANGLTYYDNGFVSMLDEFGIDGNFMIRGFISWPITNVLSNSSFEGWSPDPNGGWQNFPNDYTRWGSDGQPYGNMFVDPDGAGIYGSDATLEVYDGGHALKMWGMYAGLENMWGSVYQTFSAAELGGAGAEFDISAHMMSHADDWIGQGTNSVTVFASYWEGPYGYTYMGADYSNPFDGSFNATEWHQIGTMATIPEGATYVNIGIEFFQPNNDQHGSVYLDEFVARPVMPMIEGSIQPIADSDMSPKRTEGIFRSERKELKLLFAENIPEDSYRDAAFEFLGYKVYRDNSVIDTLEMGEHMYFDVVGEDGAVDYYVSAVYEEDGTGTISEAGSNLVTVNLQNAAPTAVNLITPEDETVITLTADNVSGSDLGIFWSNSSDDDGDQVEYTLSLCITEFDECVDTTLIGTNIFIPYSDLYETITDVEGLSVINISWDVETSDEWDVTASTNGPWTLTVDAGWMLSSEEEILPEVFALYNNYPNPFNPITNIKYDIPEVSDVRIDIYNLAGQRVRTLVSKQHQPGRYKVQWNAANDAGSPVASGMYIYKIHAKDFVSVKKLLLMK
jgi:hypothetical protein